MKAFPLNLRILQLKGERYVISLHFPVPTSRTDSILHFFRHRAMDFDLSHIARRLKAFATRPILAIRAIARHPSLPQYRDFKYRSLLISRSHPIAIHRSFQISKARTQGLYDLDYELQYRQTAHDIVSSFYPTTRETLNAISILISAVAQHIKGPAFKLPSLCRLEILELRWVILELWRS